MHGVKPNFFLKTAEIMFLTLRTELMKLHVQESTEHITANIILKDETLALDTIKSLLATDVAKRNFFFL